MISSGISRTCSLGLNFHIIQFELQVALIIRRGVTKALRKTVFTKIFVIASFGNCCFSKIRVGTSFSSFFQTRLYLQKLVLTLIFTKNRKKIAKSHVFLQFLFSRVSEIAIFQKLGLEQVFRTFCLLE